MLNRLRTLYVHLPPSLRRILSPLLAALPIRYRYGRTYFQYREYIERARTDLPFVVQWRNARWRSLLEAARQSPYWSARIGTVLSGRAPLHEFRVDLLDDIPILTKDDVRAHRAAMLSLPASLLDEVSTSGSAGEPLIFYLDRDRSTKEWAFVQSSWARANFQPGAIRAVFRGIHMDNVDRRPWEFEPSLGELRLSPFHLTDSWMERYCELILRHRATFLHGYPSAIGIFANFVLRAGKSAMRPRIEGVLCASEALLPHQRDLIESAFPAAKITSFYGMSEKVLFGSETERDGEFEMSPLYGIAELVDEADRRIDVPGRRGRIVGTGLLFHGMPLIRYDTGDMATLVEAASEANFYRMRVRDIAGRRSQEFLVGRDSQLISMTAINVHSVAYAKMQAFQFMQEETGKAVLKVIPAANCTEADVRPFLDEISAKIGMAMVFEIRLTDALAQNSRGKIKFIDQRLDLSRFG